MLTGLYHYYIMVDNRFNATNVFPWKCTVDFSGKLLKNFSYNGNYHEQYYFPRLIHTKITEKRRRESLDSSCEGDTPLDQANSTCQQSTDWFLGPNSPTCSVGNNEPRAIIPNWTGTKSYYHPEASSNLRSLWLREAMAEETSPIAADDMSGGQFPAKDTDMGGGKLPDGSESSGLRSCDSVTSEDSVFFDDCSLTSEDIDRGCKQRRREDGSDADSSFSSTCSSSSTLEGTEGVVQDGGAGTDVKDADVKVTAQEEEQREQQQQTTAGKARHHHHHKDKHKLDIHLVIPKPQIEVGGGDGLSSDSGNGSPKVSVGESGDMGDTDPGDTGQGGERASAAAPTIMSSSFEDREFDFLKAEPVRRSTSLKTYKTPPGTPHRKKGVRFADALGLDLESVRHILNLEEPPVVPKSAMEHLRVGIEKEQLTSGVKYLSALFSQPGADPAFTKRVMAGKVVLENCVVDDKDMTISGLIRVANLAFHKAVIMRYTTNAWLSSEDVEANYVHNSNDGPTDRFSFTLTVPKYFAVGQRLEFAIMYNTGGQTFWDNNCGKNYVIECYARAVPTCESDNTWMHFL